MTSKLSIPKISKGSENTMSEGIRGLVGQRMTKSVKFMGKDVTISKLSVAEVMDIQNKAKTLEQNDDSGIDVLMTVIRSAVEGAKDLSDQDFESFPMDELAKLSNEIMRFSGIREKDSNQGK
jgi:hypothetical protein